MPKNMNLKEIRDVPFLSGYLQSALGTECQGIATEHPYFYLYLARAFLDAQGISQKDRTDWPHAEIPSNPDYKCACPECLPLTGKERTST